MYILLEACISLSCYPLRHAGCNVALCAELLSDVVMCAEVSAGDVSEEWHDHSLPGII